jgi:hypothetical protein
MASPLASLPNSYAPGARVSIRDQEWLIWRIDRTSSGAAVLGVVGLSPLVEGKEARFIDTIERENGEIAIVDPRNTKAVGDASPHYSESRLVLESQIRASTPENRGDQRILELLIERDAEVQKNMGERIVLGTGIIPNRKGHPLIQRWYGVRFLGGKLKETLTLEQTFARTRLAEDRRDTQPELASQLAKLRAFLDSRTQQLELDFVESISKGLASTHDYKRQKKEADQRAIQKKHDDYKTWITETMETEDSPSIRLFAVFGNFDS